MIKMTNVELAESRVVSEVAEGRARRRLVSQWYKNAEGRLAMRWIPAVELDEDYLPVALAA
jgi:hypothetical protein